MSIGARAAHRAASREGELAGGVAARRPWWVWLAPFAVVLGVLLGRNAFLFGTPLHEDADAGAYSILIEQARRFSLLVGNYSREKFNHPGPAFLYVQSWGESLFWSVLHVVPTAWNGQLIALYALYALFAASVVATGYGWTRSVRTAAAVSAVVFLYGALHPSVFSSDWMPYEYVLAYLAFLVAISSVAAGRVQDSWIAALSGWFLIHGHACFLFFVPVLSAAAVLALAWPRRRRLRSSLRSFARRQWRIWVPVVVISAVFTLPIAVELALHWPGNFGKYFSYSSSSRSGGHDLGQVVGYALWFWWPHAQAWAVPVILFAVSGFVAWRFPAGPVRRFCLSLLAFDVLSSVAFLAYTAVGIDALSEHYIGYFYWSAPVITLLVIVLSVVESPSLRGWLGLGVAVTVAVAACAAFAAAPQTRMTTEHTDPVNLQLGPNVDAALPAGVARMAALAGGRPIVLRLVHNAWPAMTGILVQAERTGVRACVADPGWEFMVTSQFICTPAELTDGKEFRLLVPGTVPRSGHVVVRLRRAIVTAAGK